MKVLIRFGSIVIIAVCGVFIGKTIYDKKSKKSISKRNNSINDQTLEERGNEECRQTDIRTDQNQEPNEKNVNSINIFQNVEDSKHDFINHLAGTTELVEKTKEDTDESAQIKMSNMKQRHEEADRLMKENLEDIFDTTFEPNEFEKKKKEKLLDELDDLLK